MDKRSNIFLCVQSQLIVLLMYLMYTNHDSLMFIHFNVRYIGNNIHQLCWQFHTMLYMTSGRFSNTALMLANKGGHWSSKSTGCNLIMMMNYKGQSYKCKPLHVHRPCMPQRLASNIHGEEPLKWNVHKIYLAFV